ncbi:MAG: hypothetical protein KUG69_11015 [Marinosulfonomonas sp.]|nr:hypothetical protein [Marinosulfonomonas sp.]
MNDEMDDAGHGDGYGNPPRSTRFVKGVSANPAGRPKGSRRLPPYEDVLGQMMQITDEGITRRAPIHEVLPRRLLELALKQQNNAAMRAIDALETERQSNQATDGFADRKTAIHFVEPGNVTTALEPLKMGRILDRYREENARVALEPWLVEAALDGFGDRRLSLDEQKEVLQATRTPKKVTWPDWWEVLPE